MSTPDWWPAAENSVHDSVDGFADKVRKKLATKPSRIIAKKNLFLFRARVTTDGQLLARMIVDAFLSSSEEMMFGNVLEEIVIDICSHAKDGRKSSTEGVDLEYDEGCQRTIAQIKSGPNWANPEDAGGGLLVVFAVSIDEAMRKVRSELRDWFDIGYDLTDHSAESHSLNTDDHAELAGA